jgi:23S rRNA pseudouridine2457 synthase
METHQHYMLYKPYGIMSLRVPPSNLPGKRGLLSVFPFPEGVHPIGRLDEDSEGLLLLSSNSKLMAFVNGASFEKEYYVQLDGDITADAISQMEAGLNIVVKKESVRTKPCCVKKLAEEPQFEARFPPTRAGKHRPYSWVSIVLREGKFRQVRKMTAAVGFPTLRLVRVRINTITLADLKVGEVRELPTVIPFSL